MVTTAPFRRSAAVREEEAVREQERAAAGDDWAVLEAKAAETAELEQKHAEAVWADWQQDYEALRAADDAVAAAERRPDRHRRAGREALKAAKKALEDADNRLDRSSWDVERDVEEDQQMIRARLGRYLDRRQFAHATPAAESACDIDTAGEIVTGDRIRWAEEVLTTSWIRRAAIGTRTIEAEVDRARPGTSAELDGLYLTVKAAEGIDAPQPGERISRVGWAVIAGRCDRAPWRDESVRMDAMKEKTAWRSHIQQRERGMEWGY